MDLNILSSTIRDSLVALNAKDLPNLPNLGGVFEQTDITYAIVSGQRIDTNTINIKFNVSIAATFRTRELDESNYYTEAEEKNLYSLIYQVVYILQKKKSVSGGLVRLLSFELFTPESGKWRGLLAFDVDVPIINQKDVLDNCGILLQELEDNGNSIAL